VGLDHGDGAKDVYLFLDAIPHDHDVIHAGVHELERNGQHRGSSYRLLLFRIADVGEDEHVLLALDGDGKTSLVVGNGAFDIALDNDAGALDRRALFITDNALHIYSRSLLLRDIIGSRPLLGRNHQDGLVLYSVLEMG